MLSSDEDMHTILAHCLNCTATVNRVDQRRHVLPLYRFRPVGWWNRFLIDHWPPEKSKVTGQLDPTHIPAASYLRAF